MIEALSWAAFLSSMLCVVLYGHSKTQGAIIGIATAFLFIAWGLTSTVYAAAITNVVFLGLHARNLWRAIYVDVQETSRS